MRTEISRELAETDLNEFINEMHYSLSYPYDMSKSAHDEVNEIGDAAFDHFHQIDNPVSDMRSNEGCIEFLELVEFEDDDGNEMKEWLWCDREYCGAGAYYR